MDSFQNKNPSRFFVQEAELGKLDKQDLGDIKFLLKKRAIGDLPDESWETLSSNLFQELSNKRFDVEGRELLVELLLDLNLPQSLRIKSAYSLQKIMNVASFEDINKIMDVYLTCAESHELKNSDLTIVVLQVLSPFFEQYIAPNNGYNIRFENVVRDLVVNENGVSKKCRVEAIRVAGQTRIVSLLELIQSYARDESAEFEFRSSSIIALGYYKEEDDKDYLVELSRGDGPFQRVASVTYKKFSLIQIEKED